MIDNIKRKIFLKRIVINEVLEEMMELRKQLKEEYSKLLHEEYKNDFIKKFNCKRIDYLYTSGITYKKFLFTYGDIEFHMNIPIGYFTESFIKRLIELKLDKFILHSDCGGKLRYKQITKILKALKKIEFKNENWKKEFDELKELFQIAVDNRSSIIYC